MIRNLCDISEKELSYLRTHPIEVYEKLDLIRFRVECTNVDGLGGITEIKTSKGSIIDDVDCVVNTVMKDIVDFVDSNISNKVDEILDEFNGDCVINMFYAPVIKTHVIEYEKFDCPLFIISNVQSDCSDWLRRIYRILTGVHHLSFLCCSNKLDHLPDNFDINGDSFENMCILMKDNSWSLNDMDNIEGCIVKCGRKTYQIVCKDTNIPVDKTTKKIYRDMILDNFCNVMMDNPLTDSILSESKSYLELVSNLFLSYLDNTTIFSRVSFEPEDLLPPTVGYIGEMCYDRLPVAVKYVCKKNEVYKNILRILLISFDPNKNKKEKTDQDIDYKKYNELKTKINSKVFISWKD